MEITGNKLAVAKASGVEAAGDPPGSESARFLET